MTLPTFKRITRKNKRIMIMFCIVIIVSYSITINATVSLWYNKSKWYESCTDRRIIFINSCSVYLVEIYSLKK